MWRPVNACDSLLHVGITGWPLYRFYAAPSPLPRKRVIEMRVEAFDATPVVEHAGENISLFFCTTRCGFLLCVHLLRGWWLVGSSLVTAVYRTPRLPGCNLPPETCRTHPAPCSCRVLLTDRGRRPTQVNLESLATSGTRSRGMSAVRRGQPAMSLLALLMLVLAPTSAIGAQRHTPCLELPRAHARARVYNYPSCLLLPECSHGAL